MEERLIAPCGMNCGICSRYLALKNNIRSKGVNIAYCTGCRPRKRQCATLVKRCSWLLSGQVKYCYECDQFPCTNLVRLDERYRANYRMSMIENLKNIGRNGIQAFLKAEAEKWKCPGCGQPVCCHNGVCFNCGLRDLQGLKNKYRWA